MKRILLCTVIAASIYGSAFAQDIAVKPFEFEIGAGMAIGNKYGMDKVVPGHNAFMEARVNLFETSWNLGVQASFGATAKKKDDQLYHEINKFCIAVFTDYNFRNYGRVAPFIGLGIGRASIASAHLGNDLDGTTTKIRNIQSVFVMNPRVGVELFDHLRITAEYKATFKKKRNYMALNIGYSFGGGRKK